MKKILMSLVVCSLGIGGSCFGREIETLKQRDPYSNGNLIEVTQLPDNVVEPSPERELQRQNFDGVDMNRFEVVDANIGFRIAVKFMNSDKLNLKYGTEDGIVYRLGNGKNVFLQYKNSPSGRTPVHSLFYDGDPIFGLAQELANIYFGPSETDEKVSKVEVRKAGIFSRLIYRCTGLSELLN